MNPLIQLLFIFVITSTTYLSALLTEPYQSVQPIPEYPFSWFQNASQIKAIFAENDIRVVVEIGSWIGGGSTRFMGELLKDADRLRNPKRRARHQTKQRVLYAVDTWLGSMEHQPGEAGYDPILPQLYEQFLSNMIHWNLTNIVVPCRMPSVEAAKKLNIQPDLVYIDGDHTSAAVYADLTAWYPFVKDHGILCGDDWAWDTVRISVERFASENDLFIEDSGNFWRLHKKNAL